MLESKIFSYLLPCKKLSRTLSGLKQLFSLLMIVKLADWAGLSWTVFKTCSCLPSLMWLYRQLVSWAAQPGQSTVALCVWLLVGLVGWASLSSAWSFILKETSLGFFSGQQELQEGDRESCSAFWGIGSKAPKHRFCPDSRGQEIDSNSWWEEQQNHIAKGRATRDERIIVVFC